MLRHEAIPGTALVRSVDASRQGALDLLGIVRINEGIKRVVGVTFKINIMALNAIFLAKRAGTTARGFAVLSNELRVFSQDLRNCMDGLTRQVHSCVKEVSVVLQDIRHTRLLHAAVAASPAGCGMAVSAARDQLSERHAAQLATMRRKLRASLDDAFQLVELGSVLAKSAKIEAAYGQSFAPALAQVSGEFDGVVEEIRSSLESLRRSAFVAGR